jgi:hypothetical protein
VLVPQRELRHRLALVDEVLRLRDDARRHAEDLRRRKGRGKTESVAKLSLQAIKDACRDDPALSAVPFRSLYALALARKRIGDKLEDLIRRLGQGKALEIAMITDDDAVLRDELIEKGVPRASVPRAELARLLKLQLVAVKAPNVPVEYVTIQTLRAHIIAKRAPSRRGAKGSPSTGGERGPRVRWPEHLERVLAQLMNDTMWHRLQAAFNLTRSGGEIPAPMAAGDQPGTRTLRALGLRRLKVIQKRVKELGRMLRETIRSKRRSGA